MGIEIKEDTWQPMNASEKKTFSAKVMLRG
jgi:hypothetical protein